MHGDSATQTDRFHGESRKEAPCGLFDAHCHLQDDRIAGVLNAVLGRARGNGVISMMCCGCREDDWERVRALSATEGIMVSFGLHPWYVMQRTAAWADALQTYLLAVPAAGVGEIGLDNAIDKTDRVAQEEAFIRQLRLARRLGRPVSIHCRRAFGRLVELLEEEGGVERGGLIHSYSGPPELVPVFERLGLFLSFSATITQSRNKRARTAIAAVSARRLLIETDSPDRPPAGIPFGTINEPSFLTIVCRTVAGLIGAPEDDTAKLTRDNALRLFGR